MADDEETSPRSPFTQRLIDLLIDKQASRVAAGGRATAIDTEQTVYPGNVQQLWSVSPYNDAFGGHIPADKMYQASGAGWEDVDWRDGQDSGWQYPHKWDRSVVRGKRRADPADPKSEYEGTFNVQRDEYDPEFMYYWPKGELPDFKMNGKWTAEDPVMPADPDDLPTPDAFRQAQQIYGGAYLSDNTMEIPPIPDVPVKDETTAQKWLNMLLQNGMEITVPRQRR